MVTGSDDTGSRPAADDEPPARIALDATARGRLIESKVTCPFLASLVQQGLLEVHGTADNPLAGIDAVRDLGNSGGGDLGEVLALFAAGNHGFMRGDTGRLDRPAPPGFFSLELPGSQGSHPGHSGILQGDPGALASGRFSEADFMRLAALAQGGLIRRSDVGRFIAGNLARDPRAKVFGNDVLALLARDVAGVAGALAGAVAGLLDAGEDEAGQGALAQRLTRLTGENNLVGSAGEFGLLFALLGARPDAPEVEGEPAVALDDVRAMFLERRLPAGWERWRKRRADWLHHTRALARSAARAYLALRG